MLTKLKQAFQSFIEACRALTEASREQTRTIAELHNTITKVETHTRYLAHSERQRNQREGRSHV